MQPLRRRSLRFAAEQIALTAWLDLVAQTARSDYLLGLQVARMRGLVKGYGDTHERGRLKFDRLVSLLPRLRDRSDADALLETLIKAALADEAGEALDKAVAELAPETRPASRAAVGMSDSERKGRWGHGTNEQFTIPVAGKVSLGKTARRRHLRRSVWRA